jgi:hypothetical protein
MDDGGTLHSIGELARQTGLTVKTIRFYSDHGIVTPADRTPAATAPRPSPGSPSYGRCANWASASTRSGRSSPKGPKRYALYL